MPDEELERHAAEYFDKTRISDLIHLRARGADRLDETLMRHRHMPNARENHGRFDGPAHKFIDAIVAGTNRAPPCLGKSHVVANILPRHDGDGIFVESYHVARETFLVDSQIEERRVGYRYLDQCARHEGHWKFVSREAVYEWAWRGRRDASQDIGPLPAHTLRGTRALDDPLYRLVPVDLQRPKYPVTETARSTEPHIIQRLLDTQAITEICYRITGAVDRNDLSLAAECVADPQALDALQTVGEMCFHTVTNLTVSLDGSDRASAQSDFTRWTASTPGSAGRDYQVVGGKFIDTFRRAQGRWVMTHRAVRETWRHIESDGGNYWSNHPARPFRSSARDRSDPLYGYLA